jgi:hypothetical protein
MGTPLLSIVKSDSVLLSLSLSLSLDNTPETVTAHNLFQKGNSLHVLDSFVEDIHQYLVINRVKEFSHIAFQGIALASVVLAHCTKHIRNSPYSFMRALVNTARIRVTDKGWLKYFIQNSENSMVKHSIADNGFMYPSQLWIVYPKSLVWSMSIRLILQIMIQFKNILFDMELKLRNVRLVPFIRLEYLPSSE